MKKVLILGIAVLLISAANVSAQSAGKALPQGQAGSQVGPNFVDANGDGICDNFQSGARQGRAGAGRRGNGPGDGTGTGVGPKDGTGFGAGQGAGGGVCDGTGPKGAGRGRGGRR